MHVLITGASSGLGEGMARHFASLGWKLSLAARREAVLKELASSLNTETFVRPVDLSDLDNCGPAIDEAIQALGPIDVLVNNAGIQYVSPYVQTSDEKAETLFRVDVMAPLRLQRYVLEDMTSRGSGTVVNIASMAGLIPTPGMCLYNGAKAALAACSESLRVELKGSGVNIITVYPGPVTSQMEATAREQFSPSWATRQVPTGTPAGLAKLVSKAILKRRARVIYPRIYSVSWYARLTSQWLTNRATPPLRLSDQGAPTKRTT